MGLVGLLLLPFGGVKFCQRRVSQLVSLATANLGVWTVWGSWFPLTGTPAG